MKFSKPDRTGSAYTDIVERRPGHANDLQAVAIFNRTIGHVCLAIYDECIVFADAILKFLRGEIWVQVNIRVLAQLRDSRTVKTGRDENVLFGGTHPISVYPRRVLILAYFPLFVTGAALVSFL